MKRKSEILSEEMEAIRAEIKVIEDSESPTEDELQRSMGLLEEWDGKKADHEAALAREAKVDEVLRASLAERKTEPQSPAAQRGPEVMRRVEPYETQEELVRSLWSRGSFDEKDTISRALAAVERAPRHVDDAARERMDTLLHLDNRHAPLIARHMVLTGSPEYHEQFREYVASRGTYVGEALRAAMSLTDANGGYLVPFTLDPTIILTNAGAANPFRQISTIKTIATDTWNGVTSAGVSAEWTAEGVEAADASPTLGQPTITPKKADAWVFGSYEVLADSGFAASSAGSWPTPRTGWRLRRSPRPTPVRRSRAAWSPAWPRSPRASSPRRPPTRSWSATSTTSPMRCGRATRRRPRGSATRRSSA
jgi:HK97 family phage major capsid protein